MIVIAFILIPFLGYLFLRFSIAKFKLCVNISIVEWMGMTVSSQIMLHVIYYAANRVAYEFAGDLLLGASLIVTSLIMLLVALEHFRNSTK